jgi:cytochrome b subunit of formate dehydrogenase
MRKNEIVLPRAARGASIVVSPRLVQGYYHADSARARNMRQPYARTNGQASVFTMGLLTVFVLTVYGLILWPVINEASSMRAAIVASVVAE